MDRIWMRTAMLLGTLALVGTLRAQEPAQQPGRSPAMSVVGSDALKWMQITPGNAMAVVYGNPSKAGEPYVVRFRFATGSFVFVPKLMPHFAVAQGQTILQAHGVGPFAIIYADPADDPRNRPRPR